MKIRLRGFICSLFAMGLLAGCAGTASNQGAASDIDQNVLTGGPMTGTTLNDLPAAVKNTLRQKMPDAEIADIDQTTRDGTKIYEISFTQPGRNPRIYINQQGQLLSPANQSN